MILGNPVPDASASPANHPLDVIPLLHCAHWSASHSNQSQAFPSWAMLGIKSSMLVSKLLSQLPLVFIKPGLFLKSLQRPVSSSPKIKVDHLFVSGKGGRLITNGREFKALSERNCSS